MNAALRRGVVSGIFAGGFVLLGVATATAASADTGEPGLALAGSTDGSDGVGSGNQTVLDLDSPVRAVGNQVTALGDHNENTTTAEAPAAPSPRPAPAPDHTSGEDGAGSGNQSVVGVEAPVQAVGNQVAALGDHNENDADPAESPSAPAPGPASTPAHTSGEEGVGSGNQTTITACAPISVDGNQVTVVGDDNHGAAGSSPDACESASVGGSGETSGEDGVGSGNQSSVEVCVPVTISGNQVTGVGDDNHATSDDAASTCGGGEATSGHTSGEDGVGSGNQTGLDVCVPVTASGNQLTVVGDDNHAGSSGERSSCDDAGQDGVRRATPPARRDSAPATRRCSTRPSRSR